jgi:peptide/nickel transport system ATP-binding protein
MNVPLLAAKDLTKYFPARMSAFGPPVSLRAVDGVSLHLDEGETLGIAGESGCGKSTLARILVNLYPPDAGHLTFRGTLVDTLRGKDLLPFRRQVQMIFQDPFASLNPRMRVGEIIAEPLAIHGLAAGAERRKKVLELMDRCGLTREQYHRFPHEFSGGQRQRIGIARALAVSPRVIVADEPVSALDLSIQAQIVNLLGELQRDFALSYVFIAHDLSVVRHVSTRIAIMYLGKIVETGPADDVFRRFLHPYTEALISAVPSLDRSRRRIILRGDLPSPISPPSGCPFHTRCPYAEPLCVREFPPLEEKERGHLSACHFSRKLFRSGDPR